MHAFLVLCSLLTMTVVREPSAPVGTVLPAGFGNPAPGGRGAECLAYADFIFLGFQPCYGPARAAALMKALASGQWRNSGQIELLAKRLKVRGRDLAFLAAGVGLAFLGAARSRKSRAPRFKLRPLSSRARTGS